MSNTTIGELISAARAAQQISQQALAERCGLGRTYIAQLECGDRRDPSASVLRKLCKGLGADFHAAVSAWLTLGSDGRKTRRKNSEKNRV